jgi:regulator of extracellular matrix RemA (YlzA/DUF370 family)
MGTWWSPRASWRWSAGRADAGAARRGQRGKLVDATQGRKTRSVIVTDSDHVVLSAVQPETLALRLAGRDDASLEP